MRKSTKLLIGLLSFVTVLILAHYTAVAIMVAYDINGIKTSYGDVNNFKEDHPQGVETVDITGFHNVQLVMEDSFFYRIYDSRSKQTYFDFTHSELLSINGFNQRYDTIYAGDEKHRTITRIDSTTYPYDGILELHVTGKEEIMLHQSTVQLAESFKPFNVRIFLDNSNFNGSHYELDSVVVDRLDVTAYNTSSIGVVDKMKFNELNVSFLDFGSMTGGSATVNKGTFRYNDSTLLNGEMRGFMLKNMTLIHQPFDTARRFGLEEKVLTEEVVDSTKPPVR